MPVKRTPWHEQAFGRKDPMPRKPQPKTPAPEAEGITPKRYNKRINGVKCDPYRILDIYGITHPAHQHAVKKLLRAGHDPHQTIDEDIQEVIDALLRFQEMRQEERDGLIGA